MWKKDQEDFEKDLGEVKKGNPSITQENKLLNFLMTIFQWCLKQKLKQLKEQDLKY